MPVKDHKPIGEQHAEERGKRKNAGCPNCHKDGIEDTDHPSRRICTDRACPVVTFDWLKAAKQESPAPEDQPCECGNPEYSTAFTEGVVCLSCGWKGTPD